MTDSQIITEIETGSVLADLLLASSPDSLKRRMARHPVLAEAAKLIASDPSFRVACLTNVIGLSNETPEPGYAHPKRTAIAAYAYLLFGVPYDAGKLFIRDLAGKDRADLLEVNTILKEYARTISALSVSPSPQPDDWCDVEFYFETPVVMSSGESQKEDPSVSLRPNEYAIAV